MIKFHYRPIVYSSAKTLKLTALNQLTIGSLEVYGHSLTPLIPAIILGGRPRMAIVARVKLAELDFSII
jgi:hypothetical protein